MKAVYIIKAQLGDWFLARFTPENGSGWFLGKNYHGYYRTFGGIWFGKNKK